MTGWNGDTAPVIDLYSEYIQTPFGITYCGVLRYINVVMQYLLVGVHYILILCTIIMYYISIYIFSIHILYIVI